MPEVFTSYNNVISSLGFNTEENLSALLDNRIGVKPHVLGKQNETFCLSLIEEKQHPLYFSFSEKPEYTRLEKLSILSIQDVLNQSGLSLQSKNTLLIYSTTKGNIDLLENTSVVAPERIYLQSMANAIGNYFSAANKPLVLSNACISGLLAIVYAKRLIHSGQYEHVIVCGGDLVTEFVVSGFKSFNALSPEPCRPFDANRIGINIGEAVSTLLVSRSVRSKNSMRIIAGSSANDANHISGPSRTGEGLLQAIKNTFIGNEKEVPDIINAHGTATPFNDEMESIAFERAGFTTIPINSLKGYYGHTLGAAGVMETVITIEAAFRNTLLKSAGFENHGVSGKISLLKEHSNKLVNTILKTASGFGGCNAAALFSKN